MIVGDFNFPNIQWPTLTGSCPLSTTFCDFIFECNLSQLICEPTHSKGHILDLVLVSDEDLVSSVSVHSNDDRPLQSDHFMISFDLAYTVVGSTTINLREVFDYSKADWSGLCDHLLDCELNHLESEDVDEIWCILKLEIFSAMEKFIPKVKLKNHQFPV